MKAISFKIVLTLNIILSLSSLPVPSEKINFDMFNGINAPAQSIIKAFWNKVHAENLIIDMENISATLEFSKTLKVNVRFFVAEPRKEWQAVIVLGTGLTQIVQPEPEIISFNAKKKASVFCGRERVEGDRRPYGNTEEEQKKESYIIAQAQFRKEIEERNLDVNENTIDHFYSLNDGYEFFYFDFTEKNSAKKFTLMMTSLVYSTLEETKFQQVRLTERTNQLELKGWEALPMVRLNKNNYLAFEKLAAELKERTDSIEFERVPSVLTNSTKITLNLADIENFRNFLAIIQVGKDKDDKVVAEVISIKLKA